ncbi:response regulator, partial [Roseobacter sp.]|uniref:response regulator n=1 Tax=Roseobacter sp. TaxID=1907202 RepID=UPI003297241F
MTSENPYSILIVDDDKSMRQSLVVLLEAAGWAALAVPRAEMALEKLAEMSPDVVLSDVRMPG